MTMGQWPLRVLFEHGPGRRAFRLSGRIATPDRRVHRNPTNLDHGEFWIFLLVQGRK